VKSISAEVFVVPITHMLNAWKWQSIHFLDAIINLTSTRDALKQLSGSAVNVKSTANCGHEVRHKCHQVMGDCQICVSMPSTLSELRSSNPEFVMAKDMVEKYIQRMHNCTLTVSKVLKVAKNL
jgi:hypothetical protein